MITNEKQVREKFIQKYIKELSEKTNKTESTLLSEGLAYSDFKNCVLIVHEDGSISNYRHAFFVENEDCYAVFTEHCSYHEFKKDWLDSIEEYLFGYKSITIKNS